ncbi:unnamed protein product [Dicrocoelium dendriticum]|nr:unnamed protein product [Dicrocoelium dendriticum]
MFQRNSYPRSFILRCLMSKSQSPPASTCATERRTIILPYIHGISEMAARLLMPHGITVAHEATETIRNKLFKVKDRLSKKETSGVVYKISCKNCEKYYVGQTGRKLGTRLHEHSLAIRRHDEKSLMSVHMDAENHQFDLENVEILGRARNRRAREFLEAWHSGRNSINKHLELEGVYEALQVKPALGTRSTRRRGAHMTDT